MKLITALPLLFLVGCTSTAEMTAAHRKVDHMWLTEYAATAGERSRRIDGPEDKVRAAIRATYADLKLPLEPQPDPNHFTAVTALPAMLTPEEWKEVQAAENPRLKDMGPRVRLLDNPVRYYITVKTAAAPGQVQIDFALEGPAFGQARPTYNTPPLVAKYAAARFWSTLTPRLKEQGLPTPR